MTLFWVTTCLPALVAQSDTDGWKSLLYLLIVLILPLLSSLGTWLRKRSEKQTGELVGDVEDVSEEEIILLPQPPVQRPPIPQARPAAPIRPVVVIAPAAPPVRPVPGPVSPWEPPQRQPLFIPPPVAAREPQSPRADRRPRADTQQEVARIHRASLAVSRASVGLGVLTPEDLRRAILLREVLGPPVALRPPGEASWER
ncbi:MAG: hypothetical protein JXB13_15130 [Phycisphaerae bacterium]|nr:hypothetical protein [Phycisphaerae bacterium]